MLGCGANGRLGNGSTADSYTPVAVTGITSAVGVSAGGAHSCAVLRNGRAQCWGAGANGRLGNGSTADSLMPVHVVLEPLTLVLDEIVQNHTTIVGELFHLELRVIGIIDSWQITNKPAWATFSTETGVLYGVPSVSDIGDYQDITITASNASESVAYGGFTLRVLASATQLTSIIDSDDTPNRISEGATSGTAVSGLRLQVAAAQPQADAQWQVWSRGDLFAIGTTSAIVSLAVGKTLDFEQATSHTVIVEALSGSQVAYLTLQIIVENVIDNVRIADDDTGANTIVEDAAAGTTVSGIQLVLYDDDNKPVSATWSLTDDADGWFAIGSTDGVLSVASELDYETEPSPSVVIKGVLNVNPTISALFTLTVMMTNVIESYTLRVMVSNGSVTSSPAGIDCGDDCQERYNDTQAIVLTATPNAGYLFSGWAGFCQGAARQTTVRSGADVMCYAVFTPQVPNKIQIAAGDGHTCAVRLDGVVWCWGSGTKGQLGSGASVDSLVPQRVLRISTAVVVDVGAEHSCAVLANGTIQCWGESDDKRLGIGSTTTDINIPTLVNSISTAVDIAAGSASTCAVLSDGTIRCWGSDAHGQAGDGNVGGDKDPTTVVNGISTALLVSMYAEHVCARLANNELRCWGRDHKGQIGNNNVPIDMNVGDPWRSPTTVQRGLEAILSHIGVVAGGAHSCTIRTSSQIWCWGSADSNQVPVGGRQPYNLANSFEVPETGFSAVSAGKDHNCALRGGSVQCWGKRGVYSRLGDNRSGGTSAVVQSASGITNAVVVAAGGEHSCAGFADETVKCWGNGANGRLGRGSADGSNVPVDVQWSTRPVSLISALQDYLLVVGNLLRVEPQIGGTARSWSINKQPSWTSFNTATGALFGIPGAQDVGVVDGIQITANGSDSSAVYGDFSVTVVPSSAHLITIQDTNNAANQISEIATVGTVVSGLMLQARNSTGTVIAVEWRMASAKDLFAIDSNSGAIRLNAANILDFETAPELNVIVEASAGSGVNRLVGQMTLQIEVTDHIEGTLSDLDASPDTIAENSPVGTRLSGINIVFRDENDRELSAIWSLTNDVGGLFTIRSTDGVISVAQARLDHETMPLLTVVVRARVEINQDLFDELTMNVAVTDVTESYTMQVTADNGTVTSAPAGINCGDDCSEGYDETQSVVLTAVAATGYRFSGWIGSSEGYVDDINTCEGTGNTVTIQSAEDVSCRAVFSALPESLLPSERALQVDIAEVGTGNNASYVNCVLLQSGEVYCWGTGDNGRLGNGSVSGSTVPRAVFGVSTAIDLSVDDDHSCVVLSDGSAACWGVGRDRRLGDGGHQDQSRPVPVAGISTAIAIEATSAGGCALLSGGVVRCWGGGAYGEMGDGSLDHNVAPQAVTGISTATDLGSGSRHICAVLSDGSIQCWGNNSNSQLGLGSNNVGTVITRPTTVDTAGAGAGATAVDGGSRHSCGLLSAVAKCWGSGDDGRLGNNSTTIQHTPVSVTTMVVSVSAGDAHSCAVLTDGKVYCWGEGANNRLGRTSTQDSLVPVRVSGISTGVSVTAGGKHSCVILQNGRVRCWGAGDGGRLGNGGTQDSDTPVEAALPETPVSLGSLIRDYQVVVGQFLHINPKVFGKVSSWQISNKPSWAIFDSATGGLYGSPDSTDVGVSNNVMITARVGTNSVTYGPFSVTVLAAGANVISVSDSDNAADQIAENAGASVAVSGLNLQATISGAAVADVQWQLWNIDGLFAINSTSAAIRLASGKSLDYESVNSHRVVIEAGAGSGSSRKQGYFTLTITVTNALESVRLLDSNRARNTVAENVTTGTEVDGLSLELRDENDMQTSAVWSLSDDAEGLFAISSMSGALTVQSNSLDYERQHQYRIVVKGVASAAAQLSASMTMTVAVLNVLESSYTLQVFAHNGTVYSADGGIDCGSSCSKVYQDTDIVRLRARADRGYVFSGWVGNTAACRGSVSEITWSSDVDVDCYGVFSKLSDWQAMQVSISEVGASGTSVCALLAGGSVYCWGAGEHGQLGNADNADSTVPVQVSGISTAVDVDVGNGFGCAVLSDGKAACWGLGSGNRLGNGGTSNSNVAVLVKGITSAVELAAGAAHGCVRLSDATVRCWGEGSMGQLGDGSFTDNLDEPQATTRVGVARIGGGANHTCAVLVDGTVWCWGDNEFGQLGSGITTDSNVAIAVAGINTAQVVAGGFARSCAVLRDGGVRCWGQALLGGGNGDDNFMPMSVFGISSAVDLGTGRDVSCVLLADGGARCWGDSDSLGIGAVAYDYVELTPLAVPAISTAVDVSSRAGNVCVVLVGGAVQCWGDNVDGQLGNGSTNAAFSPTDVNLAVPSLALADVVGDHIAVVGILFNLSPPIIGLANSWQVANNPSWSVLNPLSGALYGVPQAQDVGVNNGVVMTARSGNTSVAYGAFSLTVLSSTAHILYVTDSDSADNTIYENAMANSTAGIVLLASDSSGTAVAGVSWRVSRGDESVFTIDTSGILRLSESAMLNYEATTSYRLVVEASEGSGADYRLGYITLQVKVLNVLEISIRDTQAATNTIAENAGMAGVSRVVEGLRIVATDELNSTPSQLIWSLVGPASDVFTISSGSVVSVSLAQGSRLDYETTQSYSLVVVARSVVADVTATAQLSITVAVVNVLESLTITDANMQRNTLLEGEAVGTLVSGLRLQARDEAGELIESGVMWGITPSDIFAIDALGVISLASADLDYESLSSTTVEVSAVVRVNQASATGVLMVTIDVLDKLEVLMVMDDAAAPNEISETASSGTVVSGLRLQAVDESDVPLQSGVIWKITPDNVFAIRTTDGVIKLVSDALDYEETTQYVVEVSAQASKGRWCVFNNDDHTDDSGARSI